VGSEVNPPFDQVNEVLFSVNRGRKKNVFSLLKNFRNVSAARQATYFFPVVKAAGA
jgi:hypothetical protein